MLPSAPVTLRPWRGSVISHHGRLLLYVRGPTGIWQQRATGLDDTPENRERAEQLLAEVRVQLQAQADAGGTGGPLTVAVWAKTWIETRRRDGVRDAGNDEQRLRDHVLPALGTMPLDQVRPRHLADVFRGLRETLAPRTVRNVYSVVRSLFRDAQIADVLDRPSPAILTHRQLGKVRDGPGFRRREAVYTRAELVTLISDSRIPEDRRVWYALLGVAMLRTGEAAGLRWRSIARAQPLDRLEVVTSYDRGETKTGIERVVPMLPVLSGILAEWRLGGWARTMGRPPTDDDLVCPTTPAVHPRQGPRRTPGSLRDRRWAYKRLRADLVMLGLAHRRAHDLRRTGISLAQDDGADRSILRWATHAPPGDVMSLYTSLAWQTLCREVGKVRIERVRAAP